MLAVCHALVTEPNVVLADELTVGLAPVVVAEIFEEIKLMRAAGRSILRVEEYVNRALSVADYVHHQQGEGQLCRRTGPVQ